MSESEKPLCVILDTNVWISGIFFGRGIPAQLLQRWRDGDFDLLLTEATLAELKRVLWRKAQQFGAPANLINGWLDYILAYATIVGVNEIVIGISRDPDDDRLLEASAAGGAQFLVTGDQDLLTLGQFRDVQIVTPREFLDYLAANHP